MKKLINGVPFPTQLLRKKTIGGYTLRITHVIRLVFITVLFIFLYHCYKFERFIDHDVRVVSYSNSLTHNMKEVYATLLCPSTGNSSSHNETNYYYEATRILAYRLLHKTSTKDLGSRQLIVLATETVSSEQIRQLRLDGVIVHTVSAIRPPKGVNLNKTKPRWKDQYTKLLLWNMTQYSKILYIDADILPIRPLSAIFETPLCIDKDGHPYLFAAVYDSSKTRTYGKFTRPVPVVGPSDTHGSDMPHAGLFLIHPSHRQAKYLQSLYDNPPQGQDFTTFMEQSMLKYAYREDGDYHWTRLSQMYNTQWPRLQDTVASYAIHDKFWNENSPVAWDLRRYWYVAWGEMQGWSNERQRNREQRQRDRR